MNRAAPRTALLLLALAGLPGCTSVVGQSAEEIRIDVGFVGEAAPGTRGWWGHLQARDHCARYGRAAELVDFRGSVAVYRCVAPAKS